MDSVTESLKPAFQPGHGKPIGFGCDELQLEADGVTLVSVYQLRSQPIITYKLKWFPIMANAIERSCFVAVIRHRGDTVRYAPNAEEK